MQNCNTLRRFFAGWVTTKTLRLMRLTAIVLLAACLHVSAKGLSQDTRVTLKEKHIRLDKLFSLLEKKTAIHFSYSSAYIPLDLEVDVEARDEKLSSVLERVLHPVTLGFRLLDEHQIAIMKETPELQTREPLSDTVKLIRGQLIDAEGKPLVNATVNVKRTGKGTATDEFGTFTLPAAIGDTLQFSMIGMALQSVRINNFKLLTITMQPATNKLNEVVVVGYGSQKKINVTGAVASVNMSDMQTPVPSLTNALAGKVAGIISVQSSGEPGYDNSTFTIRGIGTFAGNTSPLIIVDGVQRDDVNSTYGGAFNNIDPEDVASISILKDASSTAMYGAKGANGVLIITTKKGVAGKPKISLKAETGLTGFTVRPKMLDGINYMKLYNEAEYNMGNPAKYSDEIIEKTASGLDPYIYPNVNWIDQVYRKSSSLTNANVNVSGGSESVRYYISSSFYDQEGPYRTASLKGYNPNLNFKRYDFRSNIDANVTKTTTLQLNLDAMLVNTRYPGIPAGLLWYDAYATSPVAFPVRYPGGKWAGPVNNGGANPFNEVQNDGYSTEFHPSVQSVFTLNQKFDFITKGLSAYGRFSFDSYGDFENHRPGINDLWSAASRDETGALVFTQQRVGQQFLGYSETSAGERIMYLEGNISYDKSFGDHHFGLMALYNIRNRLESTAGSVIGSIPYRNESTAGRLTWSYNDKYLAEINAGYTGSENFEPGHKFGFFPAASAGWVISRENFFDHLSTAINLLKIRGSYGVVGNDNIGAGGRFPYLTQIGGGNGYGFGLNGNWVSGLTENVIGVQNLTWEKSYKGDIGLEVGLFNKFNVVVDIYNEERKNILIGRQSISSIAGYSGSTIYANLGQMHNQGMDANVEYNDKLGKVGLRLYGNVTYSKNKIVFADEPPKPYPYLRQTGTKFGEINGYIAEGLFVDQNDINSSATQKFGQVAPGDIKYKNLNPKDDNVIDGYDAPYLGKSWFPTWLYGAGFTVAYNHFDLSMLFQGTIDASIMANGSAIAGTSGTANGVGVVPFSGLGQYANNTLSIATDRWTVANPRQNAYYPRLTVATSGDNNYQSSTWWLKDGAYVRLKQASFGYTVSSAKLKRGGLSSMYFYLSGQNLLTFSKFKLWDPELGPNGAKYPITRMITCGVRAQF